MNKKNEKLSGNVEGIIKGLGDLIEKLGDLAEKGEQLKRTGEFDFTSGGKEGKGVFGFTVKTGINNDRDEFQVESFGNIAKDPKTGEAVVQEVSQPLVDIIEEEDHLLVIAEMPGVSPDDIKIDLNGDVLTIEAERGPKKYFKEMMLPRGFDHKQLSESCHNGVLEIKLMNE